MLRKWALIFLTVLADGFEPLGLDLDPGMGGRRIQEKIELRK